MFIIKQLMINDKYFHTHLSKVQVITDIVRIMLNAISLYKFNANINEFVFEYIKLYLTNHTLLTNNKHKLLFTRRLTRQEMKEKNMFERRSNRKIRKQ